MRIEPTKATSAFGLSGVSRFRIRQRVNDLVVTAPDNTKSRLTPEQCDGLVAELDAKDKLTYARVRKLLGMKKSREWNRNYVFNFEEAGDKEIIGNRTAAKMLDVLGDRWGIMTLEDRLP